MTAHCLPLLLRVRRSDEFFVLLAMMRAFAIPAASRINRFFPIVVVVVAFDVVVVVRFDVPLAAKAWLVR